MTIFYGLWLSCGLMLIAWGIYCYSQNPGIIDVFWGINIITIGLTHLLQEGMSLLKIFTALLLLVWGMRLSIFLYLTRIKQGEKDRRYEELSKDWHNKFLGFLWQYLFQGILAFVIASPFFIISKEQSITFFHISCFIVVIIGVIGETVADNQLLQHKTKALKSVCQKGLWQYSRHPNYFFECLVWLGFSMLGVNWGSGALSLISIITLFCIMWFFTIPITESAALKKRGKMYIDYQLTTSRFIPWFKG